MTSRNRLPRRNGARGRLGAFLALAIALAVPGAAAPADDASERVSITVDLNAPVGPLTPIWSWVGYDEPNYTYMKDGKKLLSQLADASPVPVYVRAHHLLNTNGGEPGLKWGSSNAYTEDPDGNAVYDWTVTDRIFDAYVERGMKPLVEIGFMPKALSSKPEPYRHSWDLETKNTSIEGGWAYPPKDYEKWAKLVYQWVRHCVGKYGRAEVETWLWEVWNEPNISWWRGTQQEYFKLYDYTVDAVKRALPSARVGGPHLAGSPNAEAMNWLREFLEHVVSGRNHVTGGVGSPIDFIAFHAKGRPEVIEDHVRMGISRQLTTIDMEFQVVASFPELRAKPVILGESDPEGCAACSARVFPHNAYRNGTMYSSYTAASFARKWELADQHGVNLVGAVTWAFEFENQPYFDGFRSLATNGIEKPVLNVFRMYGLMGGMRVRTDSSQGLELAEIRDSGVRERADIAALATRDERSAAVMVWNYHDDDLPADPSEVAVAIGGVPADRVLVEHYRIDDEHSNAYAAWKRMGSPQNPTAEQYRELERSAQLHLLNSPQWAGVAKGRLELELALPRQGVSLIRLSW